jgi:hypothetical protein
VNCNVQCHSARAVDLDQLRPDRRPDNLTQIRRAIR